MEMSFEFALLCWRKSGPLVFQCVPVWSGSKTALCRRCAGGCHCKFVSWHLYFALGSEYECRDDWCLCVHNTIFMYSERFQYFVCMFHSTNRPDMTVLVDWA